MPALRPFEPAPLETGVCQVCHGSRVVQRYPDDPDLLYPCESCEPKAYGERICGTCGGTGEVPDDNSPTGFKTCPYCLGKGRVKASVPSPVPAVDRFTAWRRSDTGSDID
jgi:hypothetical protein